MIYDKIFERANPTRIDDEHPQELWCGVQGVDGSQSIQDVIFKQRSDILNWWSSNAITPEDGPAIQCDLGSTEGAIGVTFGHLTESNAVIISQQVSGYTNFRVSQYPWDDKDYKEYLTKKEELDAALYDTQLEIQRQEELEQESNRLMKIYKESAKQFVPMEQYDFLVLLPEKDEQLSYLGAEVGEWWEYDFKDVNKKTEDMQEDDWPKYSLNGYVYKKATRKLSTYMNPDVSDEQLVVSIQTRLDQNWREIERTNQSLVDIISRINDEESDLEQEYEKLARETDPEQRRIIEENIHRIEDQLVIDRQERMETQELLDEQKNNYPKPYDDFKESTGNRFDHQRQAQRTFFKVTGIITLKTNIVSAWDYDEETWYIYKNLLDGEGEVVDVDNWDYNAWAFWDTFQEMKNSYQSQVGLWRERFDIKMNAKDRLVELEKDLKRIKDELSKLKDPKRKIEITNLECFFFNGESFTIRGMLGMGQTVSMKGKGDYTVLSGNGWDHPNEQDVNVLNPEFGDNKFVKYTLDDTLYRTITLNESIKDKIEG